MPPDRTPAVDMRAYLQRIAADGTIHFKANPGNAGDALIASATFQIFNELGIDFEIIPLSGFDPKDKIVVYGGGGNLIEGQTYARQFVEHHHRKARKLVVLPSSISGHADLLASLGTNVDIFAREDTSLQQLKNHALQANVMISDDMAFHLMPDRILTMKPGRHDRSIFQKRFLRRQILIMANSVRRHCLNTSTIHCYRTDREKTSIKRPLWNADISKWFGFGTRTPDLANQSSHLMLSFLNQYQEVHTNRLHIAIAGALLDKHVHFHPNAYFKCQAVYRYSMMDRFPKVDWIDPDH